MVTRAVHDGAYRCESRRPNTLTARDAMSKVKWSGLIFGTPTDSPSTWRLLVSRQAIRLERYEGQVVTPTHHSRRRVRERQGLFVRRSPIEAPSLKGLNMAFASIASRRVI